VYSGRLHYEKMHGCSVICFNFCYSNYKNVLIILVKVSIYKWLNNKVNVSLMKGIQKLNSILLIERWLNINCIENILLVINSKHLDAFL